MNQKVLQAVEYMKGPHSCSQSVLCAFCEDAGLTYDDAKKIAAPYSGGRAIKCGALYAGEVFLKSKFGEDTNLVDELDEKFLKSVGAVNCCEIRSKNLRPCIGCVEESATILNEIISANNF